MSNLPITLGVSEAETCSYADNVWARAKDLETVKLILNERASKLVTFAGANALSLNASKTQLLLAGKSVTNDEINPTNFKVSVGDVVNPSEIELLGVKFGQCLSVTGHGKLVTKCTRHHSSLVARLALHIPRMAPTCGNLPLAWY